MEIVIFSQKDQYNCSSVICFPSTGGVKHLVTQAALLSHISEAVMCKHRMFNPLTRKTDSSQRTCKMLRFKAWVWRGGWQLGLMASDECTRLKSIENSSCCEMGQMWSLKAFRCSSLPTVHLFRPFFLFLFVSSNKCRNIPSLVLSSFSLYNALCIFFFALFIYTDLVEGVLNDH